MRTKRARTWAARSIAGALVVFPAAARAQQIDVNPPLPNVLLLIDNSGSMERMIDGSLPEDSPQNACNCDASNGTCNWTTHPTPNRWGIMLQALTGSFQNGYNCAAMPRTPSSVFASEFQIAGVNPYDTNYYIPFHRPIAEDTQTNPLAPLPCVYAPGALPGAQTPAGVGPQGTGAGGAATDFPPTALVQHTYGISNTKSCVFSQNQDGALDAELDILRFGLMTFDQDPSAATGVTANNTVASPAFTGMWSYFPGWNTGAACTYLGAPANCSTQTMLAVGARNPAAPPWEGRMIPLPATTDIATQETQNARIQQVLLSSRPYGATPLAGMFVGAQYYLQTDPTGPQQTDTYVKGGCRSEYIILLTDGAPNLDMQPQCSAPGSPSGVCPFPAPETTAQSLHTPSNGAEAVTTYVIGFAVSSFQDQGTTIYCSNLVSNGQLAAVCGDPSKQALYGPCCELQKIAIAGGTGQAYFADTPGDLQNALGSILSQIAKNTTTRTMPAYSPVTNALADPTSPQTNASLFLASFNPTPGQPWSGDLQRQRFLCTYAGSTSGSGSLAGTYSVSAPTPNASSGDDFAANLNAHSGPARSFIALQPDALAGTSNVDATAVIRPYVANNVGDGMGKYSATTYAGPAASVTSSITPTALGLTDSSCIYNPVGGGAAKKLSPAQCRDMLLDYTFGQQSFSTGPSDFPFVSRYNNAFGDVFHATPAVVGPPAALLHDDSYVAFRAAYATRKQIVYTATNDGLLHAFWADESKLENNEMWAIMPPAVMPNLLSSYPANHEFLLDGSPVVKDVVWDRAISNQGDPTNWHTMLVAGFGSSQRGYYAVDVTNPDITGMTSAVVPTDPPPVGPVFRWQLTKMPATNAPLFGAHSATPAITSLFVDPGDGSGAREIGVAILPGGVDSGPTSSASGGPACPRAVPTTTSEPVTGYTARASVRCWGANQKATDPVVGRSLTIVRVDTGEILRVFMRLADTAAFPLDTLVAKGRITDTPLDSPMTGVPVVFPTDVGTDATKVFVGDADGTVWRFDLSSSDPSAWFGERYLDLYNQTVDTSSTSWADGQTVQLAPVVSLDTAGNVVVNVATGSQETFDSTGTYYVYSISEIVQGTPAKLRASVNWWLNPTTVTNQPGERVSGPMTVFDGVLYFATYAAPPPGTQSCTSGDARLWGRDFVQPKDTNDLSKGGVPRMQPPQGQTQVSPLPDFIQPDQIDPTLRGVVIPGVSIKATPACAGLGTPGADQYVFGAQHASPQSFSSGQYSLFTQMGAKGASGSATRQLDMTLPTPVAPTMIDSWAAVIE
ncbi:MAG TPA: PilC/PilY family type IV pilus protein [Polyangiaceae bacterium]|nr:PilC/PilY family type IV pilus protein [Polyangiaceae bacterium]